MSSAQPAAGSAGGPLVPGAPLEPLAPLDRETRALVSRGWEVRLAERPGYIGFDSLRRTRAVSVTGAVCGSGCAHCGGRYLERMLGPAEARRLAASPGEVRSWLVSGGCGPDGTVPLLDHELLLESLGRAGRVNLHTGLVRTPNEARALARWAGAVSLDFTVDGEAIASVYGFRGVRARDFVRAYELLAAETVVMPHVLIGLAGGRVRSEIEALRTLARMGAPGVVLLVLIPTPGTRFGTLPPPPLGDAVRVMAEARLLFPDRPVHLGCMRPKGSYREALDRLAVRAGVDRIAVPTPRAVRDAVGLGFEPVWSEECCVFPLPGAVSGTRPPAEGRDARPPAVEPEARPPAVEPEARPPEGARE